MATEENGNQNGNIPVTELDIPTISNGSPSKEKRRGPLGLGGSAQAGATGVARSGLGGILVRNMGLMFKLGPLMATITMSTIMPAINRAASVAEYEKAKAMAMGLRSEGPLPSDAAVAKMRQNSNLDNEALVRSKHAGSGMKFGDEEYAEQQGGEETAAKDGDAGKAAGGGSPGDADAARAAEEAQRAAAAQQQTKFGEGGFGKGSLGDAAAGGAGGGGSGFSGGTFGNKIVNYAPESAFKGGLKPAKAEKGKAQAAQQAKALGKGGDKRGQGGRAKTARGQLRAAMQFSKNAKGMKQYQASAATAGRAFDGGTVTSDVASGIGAAGVGNGGAGAGDIDQAEIDNPDNFKKDIPEGPKIDKPKAIENESCEGKNLDEMKNVMDGDKYGRLEKKCKMQKTLNEDFLWLAGAGLLCIGVAAIGNAAKAAPPWTSWMIAGAIAMCAAILAVVVKIVADISASKDFPDLKGQCVGLGIGAAITTASAIAGVMGAIPMNWGSVMGMVTSSGSNVSQGMSGGQG